MDTQRRPLCNEVLLRYDICVPNMCAGVTREYLGPAVEVAEMNLEKAEMNLETQKTYQRSKPHVCSSSVASRASGSPSA